MRNLNVIVTGAGAPGIKGTLESLKNNYDGRFINVIGTDASSGAVGRHLCDEFFVIPKAVEKAKYLAALFELVEKLRVDVIVPQNTMELDILSESKADFEKVGCKILLSDNDSIQLANNKHTLMMKCKDIGVPVGEFYLASDFATLKEHAQTLGWPETPVVVKPPISNGQRGVRVIDESLDRKELFYSAKPSSLNTTMEELYGTLGDNFDELIVTEYLPGEEYTVDAFAYEGKSFVLPRKRVAVRSGITFVGQVEKHEQIIRYVQLLIDHLDPQMCFGFQFKLDQAGVPKILESNPRVQGTMVLSTIAGANIIYTGIKALLQEDWSVDFDVDWDAQFLRYWGGVGISTKGVILI